MIDIMKVYVLSHVNIMLFMKYLFLNIDDIDPNSYVVKSIQNTWGGFESLPLLNK